MADTIVRPTLADLRSLATEHGDKLRELRNKPADERGDTYASDVRSAIDAIHLLDAEITALERATPPEPRGPEAAFGPTPAGEGRSAGDAVIDRDAFRDWAKSGGAYRDFPEVELRGSSLLSPEVRALLDEAGDDNAALLLPAGQPILPRPRQRRLFVRDLITVQQTGLASVPYVRELNPTTNETGASSVAEAAAKPEVTMEWESDDAPVRKIAAWVPVTMEILADAATLRGYIDTRLAYMLALREELQILNGSGTSPDLKGILQFTGVQTQAATTDDVPATIADAIAKVENVDGVADGIAMNPLDYWAGVSTRFANQLDFAGEGTAPIGAPPPTIWGLRVVRTRALAQGDAIVADWAMGATLFDRMRTTIRTSDSHDDYFVKNKVAILAEERVALAVHRPDFFVDVTITFS